MNYAKWRARLANANDPAFIPIEHIDALLEQGLAQFWATPDAAMVTEMVEYPGGAIVCRAVAAAGKKSDLLNDLKAAAEAWAAANGATHAMLEGRDGWRTAVPDYRHYQTILVKELA